MTRITTTVLIMLLLLNGTATIMTASGLSEDLGVTLSTGVDDKMDSVVEELRQGFNPNVNVVESFISLALAAVRVFQVVVEGVFAAPTLIINLLGGGELVTVIVGVFMAPLYVISTLEILSIAIGNRTV